MLRLARRTIIKGITVAALAVAVSLVTIGMANPAHAASSQSAAKPPASAAVTQHCFLTIVTLHGSNPSTVSCAERTKPSGRVIGPNFGTHPCGNNLPTPWIALYENINYGGLQICFVGTGSDNMANYWINWPVYNWSQAVSAFNMGANGRLTQLANGNGNGHNYSVGEQTGNISAYWGSGWNDNVKWASITS